MRTHLTASDLRHSFDFLVEQLCFTVGDTDYLVVLDYDLDPWVQAMLCFEDDEGDWVPLDDDGEPYTDDDSEDEPPQFCGFPNSVAARIVSAVSCHAT